MQEQPPKIAICGYAKAWCRADEGFFSCGSWFQAMRVKVELWVLDRCLGLSSMLRFDNNTVLTM